MRRRRTRYPPPTADQRPTVQRLEALITDRKPARWRRTLWRIRQDLIAAPAPGPWIAAARALHEGGRISADVLAYFVEIFLECVTFSAAIEDAELCRIQDEMEAVERAHGLEEDEFWPVEQAPETWRVLDAAWNRRDHAIRVAFLRELGHKDLGGELERDQAGFDARGSRGQRELWGPDDREN